MVKHVHVYVPTKNFYGRKSMKCKCGAYKSSHIPACPCDICKSSGLENCTCDRINRWHKKYGKGG